MDVRRVEMMVLNLDYLMDLIWVEKMGLMLEKVPVELMGWLKD